MRLRSVQRSVQRGPVHGLFGRETFPGGAILHWDADIGAFSEQTGGVHTFNHAVLSPQYQRNSDGSYSDVGAKPAVDVFGGKKWLRSCGAITNLLPSGAEYLTTWTNSNCTCVVAQGVTLGSGAVYDAELTSASGAWIQRTSGLNFTSGISYTAAIKAKYKSGFLQITYSSAYFGSSQYANFDLNSGVLGSVVGGSASIVLSAEGFYECSFTATATSSVSAGAGPAYSFVPGSTSGRLSGAVGIGAYLCHPTLTATAYPAPYVPPGVTQPASNATTTNGCWFSLPDGSEMWQALDGQVDGVELAANGGFSDGLASWVTYNGVGNTYTIDGGSLHIVKPVGSTYGQIYQVLPVDTSVGRFKISFSVDGRVGGSNTWYLAIGSSPVDGPNKIYINSNGVYELVLAQAGTDNRLYISSGSSTTLAEITIDNISIQRIQPQPLTLATRVRMGVGSGDLPAGGFGDVVSCIAMVFGLQYFEKTFSGSEYINRAYDRSSVSGFSIASWPRNSIIRRVTQVNTAGTQFRVGYMIEGTHTAIQWSSWVAFDGSFNPSTLYRLMLGYLNPYPMWFNKITAWKKQVTDAEILEAMA